MGCVGKEAARPDQLVPGGIVADTHQALKNIGAVLRAADTDYSSVVKTTVFLADINDSEAMNDVYRHYFKPPYPARIRVQVARLAHDARVEIEAIALVRRQN